jgi:hypothetical protein
VPKKTKIFVGTANRQFKARKKRGTKCRGEIDFWFVNFMLIEKDYFDVIMKNKKMLSDPILKAFYKWYILWTMLYKQNYNK